VTAPRLLFDGPKSPEFDRDVHVDLERLYESRLLIQGVSGSGKSTAIRSLLEQTHGKVPQLVVDFDGDFVTLREKFDYVLVGPGSDVPIAIKTAKIMIRRLVELGVSAIFDVSELKFDERRMWVKLACEELVHLPRSLWSTRLFVLDEAHIFAPERSSGESVATQAVIDVITLGRKRGIVTVCATQRLSKLHKDAAAELNNKLIGYTDDVDLQRAGDQLGMTKEQRAGLKLLETHTFYAYGPAISRAPVLVQTAMPATKPPPRGESRPAAPPARAAVQKVLAQLADLPKEAEEEARSIADLQRRNADLERRIRQAERVGVTKEVVKTIVDQAAIDKAVKTERRVQYARLRPIVEALLRAAERLPMITAGVKDIAGAIEATNAKPEALLAPKSTGGIRTSSAASQSGSQPERRPVGHAGGDSRERPATSDFSLGKGEKTMLTAIAQYPDGALRDQLTVLTGYKRSSRDTYIQRLAAAGFVEVQGDSIVATDAGVDALGSEFEPLPTGEALQQYWLARLPEGERKILDILIQEFPTKIDRDAISDATGYKRSSRDTYLQRLSSRRLIETAGGVRASPILFDEALV
jgi:hypothetical protein